MAEVHRMAQATDEVHDLPLAHRLISEAVSQWLDTRLAIAAAASPEDDADAVINRIKHLHLAGFDSTVTPKIVEQLERAGLLRRTTADR